MEFPTEAIKKMEEYSKRSHRLDGWRTGSNLNESRRERIKRIRRWRRCDNRYPEIFSYNPDNKLALVTTIQRYEYVLFVTSVQSPDISRISEWNGPNYPTRNQYNGYCRFMHKPVIEEGRYGLLTYVPVHGGITYASHQHGVSVYGFDTAHAGDENNPLCQNVEWVEAQAELMAVSIKVAARYEKDYLRFKDRYVRCSIIEKFLAEVEKKTKQKLTITNNLGCMINLLSGQI